MNRRDAIKAAIGGAAACVLPAVPKSAAKDFRPWVHAGFVKQGADFRSGTAANGKLTMWARIEGRWFVTAQEC